MALSESEHDSLVLSISSHQPQSHLAHKRSCVCPCSPTPTCHSQTFTQQLKPNCVRLCVCQQKWHVRCQMNEVLRAHHTHTRTQTHTARTDHKDMMCCKQCVLTSKPRVDSDSCPSMRACQPFNVSTAIYAAPSIVCMCVCRP